MKVSSNKAKVTQTELKDAQELSKKPSYRVEQISNGFIIEKSWYDKDKGYQCVKTYSATNPLEK